MKRFLAMTLALLMLVSILPMSVFASDFDTSVSGDYFKVISENKYALAPGASETELVVNNADGNDRKVVHYFEVDTKNENIEVLPGYYGIDKLDPDNLPLTGIADKSAYWKAMELTKTVAYYEAMGYNVVGAMNTALAYDSNAPYGYMVWDGVVLGTPEVHKGAQTYLAIDFEGNCELRSMSTPLNGTEKTAISANFGWLVKDGVLQTKTVERTSSDASRSMIGIKEDGTLVFCQVDGRNGAISSGLSNYEMGEMMLSIGCVNAVNCDGGGSSTFVSKREGETVNTMRSVPSDGAERPTINSVILVSKAKPTGEFDHAVVDSEYDYYAPTANGVMTAAGVDTSGSPATLPTEGITWAFADTSFGTIHADGSFTLANKKGDVTVQMLYNGDVVGEKVLHVVDPEVFALLLDETVLPYGKGMTIEFACTYGADDWAVCVDGAYTLTLSNNTAATLVGNTLTATSDESIAGVDVTATYTPNTTFVDTLKVTYGKGSEIVFDFEDGDISDFLGMDEMYDWAEKNGASAPIQSNSNYSEDADSETFLSTDIVKNGQYALGVTLDYTDAQFATWSYNMFFYTGDVVVLRDVANGKNATTFGMWVYIPEGAAGLAMQMQGYKNPDGTGGTGGHFMFTTVSGVAKNLNSCTEADIPESRWVYATCDLTQFGDFFATYNPYGTNGREPSFIRFYVKPTTAANLTFYYDDFTLDYSSAVDDRVLPTISNVSYATADESTPLEQNSTISGNSVSFSAIVADNIKLDNATGKIYVDGNLLPNVTISGKYLAAEAVTLMAGTHTVAFEIKDTMGNLARVTRTFTVSGEAAVTLGGHNDSGLMPEYGSVYYVDINAINIENINKLTATLKLQTANTWVPEGTVVADGFKFSYDLNQREGYLTVTVERNGDIMIASNADTILISIPVRLWTWDGVNHVTDVPVAPETHFATGNCPVVTIDCEVISSEIDYADGTSSAFGGNISVETKINDNIYPWHYHDTDLTVLNKDATCTEDGYTGRTYCETCQSVVDFGTIIEATGHNFVVDGDVLVCEDGDATINATGLVPVGEKIYCMIAGKLVTGWQNVDGEWVYVNATTKEVQVGSVTVSGITYETDESGFVKPAWVTDSKGMKCSFGPAFYTREWVEMDGAKYYFGTDSYVYTGLRAIIVNRNNTKEGWRVYTFADDGKLLDEMLDANGLITTADGIFYVENGKSVYGGLMLIDGDYYYIRTEGKAVTNATYWPTKTNDLLPAKNYTFGADGKMINPPVVEPEQPPVTPDPEPEVKNGIVEEGGKLWWYVDNVKTYAGLMLIDGDYYYARTSGEILTNVKYWITKTNDLLPAANYNFGADGKMLDAPVVDPEQPPVTPDPEPEVKNGIVEEGGKLWWYVDGVKTYGGLMLIDGDYYYARTSGEILTNVKYWITKTNDLLPAANYNFGADGKMVK